LNLFHAFTMEEVVEDARHFLLRDEGKHMWDTKRWDRHDDCYELK
jgi:hypothetical protein